VHRSSEKETSGRAAGQMREDLTERRMAMAATSDALKGFARLTPLCRQATLRLSPGDVNAKRKGKIQTPVPTMPADLSNVSSSTRKIPTSRRTKETPAIPMKKSNAPVQGSDRYHRLMTLDPSIGLRQMRTRLGTSRRLIDLNLATTVRSPTPMSTAKGLTLTTQVGAVRSAPRLQPSIGSGLEPNINKNSGRNIARRNRNGEKSAAKSAREEKETSS